MKLILLVVCIGLVETYASPTGEEEEELLEDLIRVLDELDQDDGAQERSLDDWRAGVVPASEDKPHQRRGFDATAPYFENCPADITTTVSPSTEETWVDWIKPTAKDDSGVAPKVEMTAGNPFRVGRTAVAYVATDEAGNVATCLFVVNVVQVDQRTLDDDLARALEDRFAEEAK